jgi:hypothetical protein
VTISVTRLIKGKQVKKKMALEGLDYYSLAVEGELGVRYCSALASGDVFDGHIKAIYTSKFPASAALHRALLMTGDAHGFSGLKLNGLKTAGQVGQTWHISRNM